MARASSRGKAGSKRTKPVARRKPGPRSSPKVAKPTGDGAAKKLAAVPDAVVERVVAELTKIRWRATVGVMLEIGDVVIADIYGGDMKAVRSRGRKHVSFRKLSRHPKLPYKPMLLSRAVGVTELLTRFPGFKKAKHVGASHLRAVLGLPADIQERLLTAAEQEVWSTEKIEARAAQHRPAGKAGRPRTPPARRIANTIAKKVREGLPEIAERDFENMSEDEARVLREELAKFRVWQDVVDAALGKRLEVDGAVSQDRPVRGKGGSVQQASMTQ